MKGHILLLLWCFFYGITCPINYKTNFLFFFFTCVFKSKMWAIAHTLALPQYIRPETQETNRRTIGHVHKLLLSCDDVFPADPCKSTRLDTWVTQLTSHIVLNACVCAPRASEQAGVKKRCVGGCIFIVYYAHAAQRSALLSLFSLCSKYRRVCGKCRVPLRSSCWKAARWTPRRLPR